MGLTSNFAPTEAVRQKILDLLGENIVASALERGDFWIQIKGEHFLKLIDDLRSDAALDFDSFVDLCGVDYLTRKPRFEVVTHLYSISKKHRIRIKCLVPDGDMTVPSLTSRWSAANWQEREAYDMYGIRFEGHPKLDRILSAPNTKAFPQRKDYPLKGEREIEEDS